MTESRETRTLILGIGNAYRGDDRAGIEVVRRLGRQLPMVDLREVTGDGAEIIDAMAGYERAVVIDASRSGGRPGTVTEFDVSRDRLPVRYFSYSTHAFGLAEAIEVARAIGRIPSRLTVFAIEGERFEAGEPLSESVQRGIGSTIEKIEKIVFDLDQTKSTGPVDHDLGSLR